MNAPEVALLRDPIFNNEEILVGYELKPLHVVNNKFVGMDTTATANFLHQVISVLSNENQATDLKEEIFLPISIRFVAEELVLTFAPEHLIFEVSLSENITPQLEQSLSDLGRRYRFAIVNTPYSKDLSKFSLHYSILDLDKFPDDIITELKKLKSTTIMPILRGINTREQFRQFKEFKVFYQGRCFSEPEKIAGATLNPSLKQATRVLQMILEEDPDLREVEKEIKRDVALTYSLIRLVRSPLYGVHYANTIHEALIVLGFKELWRWLSILAYAQNQPNAKYGVLAYTAGVRARFAELLIEKIAPHESKAEMFIVGMFSLLDVLLHMSMKDIVDQLKLSSEMSEALLMGEGIFGKILRVVISFEGASHQELIESCAAIKVLPTQASEYHVRALHWAGHNLSMVM